VEQEIIKVAATQGLWALLFVALLFWVLRENAKREDNYQQLLQDLTSKLGILKDVQRDVGEIKQTVSEFVR
jgi:hypothetical protein